MDVRTQTLRYFLGVAEEMSFSTAAHRLGISQPAVSRQIRLLEEQIGVPLFERNTRDVRLTAAGGALLEPARQTLAMWESAARLARTAAADAGGVLRVGYEATGIGALAPAVRASFTERFPEVGLTFQQYWWGGEVAALHEGHIDVAFIWLPADTTGLFIEVVAQEDLVVGVASTHRLARRPALTPQDVYGEPMSRARSAPRDWVEWWALMPRSDGSEPRWGPPSDNMEELLEWVASGAGVCVMPQSAGQFYQRSDLVWIPLTAVAPLRVALGWPVDNHHGLAREFASLASALAAHPPGGRGFAHTAPA